MKRLLFALMLLIKTPAPAGDLTVDLGPHAQGVTLVGALNRFDTDGLPRTPIDPKAAIDNPRLDATATRQPDNTWRFQNLPLGRYDLVLIDPTKRIRLEGFHYPPITDFDPFLPPTAPEPDPDARADLTADIAAARHYENKVAPLYLATNDKADQVRILMQLVRDLPTSFDADYGTPVATVRHEIWQYTYRYGAWSKDRKTAVLDRLLLPRAQFHKWTWLWSPSLGNLEIDGTPAKISFAYPLRVDAAARLQGWLPILP